MIFTLPNSFGSPLVEVNHCHGPGRGHPCVNGSSFGEYEKLDEEARAAAPSRIARMKVGDPVKVLGTGPSKLVRALASYLLTGVETDRPGFLELQVPSMFVAHGDATVTYGYVTQRGKHYAALRSSDGAVWVSSSARHTPERAVQEAKSRHRKTEGRKQLVRESQADLKKKYGIERFEFPTPESSIRHIGFAPASKKWYGWSHRAIFGFKVGDVVKKGDVIADTSEFSGRLALPVGFTAKTLADARRMAAAFAIAVS